MRKIFLAAGLMAALMFTLVVSAAAPANFAGAWSLDKSKSQNLNRRLQVQTVSPGRLLRTINRSPSRKRLLVERWPVAARRWRRPRLWWSDGSPKL